MSVTLIFSSVLYLQYSRRMYREYFLSLTWDAIKRRKKRKFVYLALIYIHFERNRKSYTIESAKSILLPCYSKNVDNYGSVSGDISYSSSYLHYEICFTYFKTTFTITKRLSKYFPSSTFTYTIPRKSTPIR